MASSGRSSSSRSRISAAQWVLRNDDAPMLLFGFLLVPRPARREVVHVGHRFFHRVGIVQRERPTGDLHRNRSARTLAFLLLWFGAGPALRFRIGSEVARARRSRCVGIEGPRSAKRPGRPRGEAAAWPWAREAARAGRAARSAIFARARLADREGPSVEDLPIEFLNGLLGVRTILELHERKT